MADSERAARPTTVTQHHAQDPGAVADAKQDALGDPGDQTGRSAVDPFTCPQCNTAFDLIERSPEGKGHCPNGHTYRIKAGAWEKVG